MTEDNDENNNGQTNHSVFCLVHPTHPSRVPESVPSLVCLTPNTSTIAPLPRHSVHVPGGGGRPWTLVCRPGVAGKKGSEGQHDCLCSALSERCYRVKVDLDTTDVGRAWHGNHVEKAIAPSAKECDVFVEHKQVLEPLGWPGGTTQTAISNSQASCP